MARKFSAKPCQLVNEGLANKLSHMPEEAR